MNIKDFLKETIKSAPVYSLKLEEKKAIQIEGITKFIQRKLKSTKYRSSKLHPILEEKINHIVSNAVKENLPIYITIPFGGYKKWQLPTAPNVDFSEVFNIVQLIRYLSPIIAAYLPGVILNYYSDEVFISKMNKIDQSDIDLYNNQLSELLSIFQKDLPHNFELRYSKIRDHISQDKILQLFEKEMPEHRLAFNNLSKEERQIRINKSLRNYKEDLSNETSQEREKIYIESTLIHDAFANGNWDAEIPWAFDENMIPIGFRYTKTWGLPLKSTQSSAVQFWVGFGVLLNKKGEFIMSSLTYEQYSNVKEDLKFENLDIFPTSFKGLQKIPTLEIK